MAQLGDGSKKILLTGQAQAKPTGYQPQFISSAEQDNYSGREVYFRWLSRLVMLCAIVSLTFFLCSTMVIYRLAPEIITEPLLIINQSDSESMVRYEPIKDKMPSLRQLTEMYIRQYITMRNTVINDEREMRTRWGPGGIVHYLSAPEVYADFVGQNSNSVDSMFDADFSSETRIDDIGKDGDNTPAWTVRFTVYSLSRRRNAAGSLTLKTKRYKASITPGFFPRRRLIRPRLINPLGFTVVKYNQSEISE